jgi:hypothetical protein
MNAKGGEVVPPESLPQIPTSLLQAQQAFWWDLPELLKDRRNQGKWVAYSAKERIGIAGDDTELIQLCLRRGLQSKDYYLDIIETMSQPPWSHIEEVDYGLAEYEEESTHPAL